jgi:hypothetical protein
MALLHFEGRNADIEEWLATFETSSLGDKCATGELIYILIDIYRYKCMDGYSNLSKVKARGESCLALLK